MTTTAKIIQPTAANVYLIEPQKQKQEKVRYAAYVRVSSDSDDQLHSYATQISHYNRLLKEHPEWELMDIYADEGISGLSADKRDDFQRMLLDCRLGKIDRIITKNVSRFSREITTTISTIRELMKLGISVYFEDDKLDTVTMNGETLLSIQGILAQQGSLTISKNQKQGCRMRMKNGTFKQSSKPLGYTLVDKMLVVDSEEAEIVRRIFNGYLSGMGVAQIAAELNADGIIRKNGKTRWHHTAISLILKNERYIGDQLWQKNFTTDTLPLIQKRNHGELDMYYIENIHEPIVSREVFDSVQGLIRKRREHHFIKTPIAEYTFSKLIKCSECGSSFRRKVINNITYWACNNRDKQKTDCTIIQIPQTEIESAFIKLYNKLKQGSAVILSPILEKLIELKTIKNQSNERFAEITNKIREIAEQSNVLNGLRAKGIIDSALCISQQTELNARMEKLRKAKQHLLLAEESDEQIMQTKILITAIEDGPHQLETFDAALFRVIISHIIAKPGDKLTFKLINGLELTETVERSNRR